MANLMVAAGMEDEGEYKEYMQRSIGQNKRLEQKIEPCINEMEYASRDVIGAENAKIKLDRKRNITEEDIKNVAFSFASPTKKWFYKLMDTVGLFRPEKVIYKEIQKIDNRIEALEGIENTYDKLAKRTEAEYDLLKTKYELSEAHMLRLKEEMGQDSQNKEQYCRKMFELDEQIKDIQQDICGIQNDKMYILDTMQAIHDQICSQKLLRRELYGGIKTATRQSYTNAELKKVLEAYEKI